MKSGLLKVLIIEDDVSMQSILHHSLKNRFSLKIFDNGMDGLAWLQAGNLPDLIITDLNTPIINGLQVLEQVKSSGFFNSIPIIVLSGEDSTDTKITCLEAGAEDYIVKPFNPRELIARLVNILKRIGKEAVI